MFLLMIMEFQIGNTFKFKLKLMEFSLIGAMMSAVRSHLSGYVASDDTLNDYKREVSTWPSLKAQGRRWSERPEHRREFSTPLWISMVTPSKKVVNLALCTSKCSL